VGLQQEDDIRKSRLVMTVSCVGYDERAREEETTVMALSASCAPEHGQAPGWEKQVTGPSAAPRAVLGNVPLGKKQWQEVGVNLSRVKALAADGFRQKYISIINPYFSF